jgi:hypothetical protein
MMNMSVCVFLLGALRYAGRVLVPLTGRNWMASTSKMMDKYILALDQGTTSSRAIVLDHDGRIVAAAQQELPQILPSPGIVEHDPEAIWSSQLDVAR